MIRQRREVYALDMVQRERIAAMEDAPIKQGKEEHVSDMVPRG